MSDSQSQVEEYVDRASQRAAARAAMHQIRRIVTELRQEQRRNRLGVVLVCGLFILGVAVFALIYLS